ncbi:uncharacterized protein LOC106092337 [Stomoxys calcitrans]|uniref:Uncharacterized protein n=1 Tax=Stomoxys calcitrans TaxID=35570 RepID=A0A1I8PGN2_STOCA|nr:uncharacterized protein LOC106092337 [Stomoxys calcitrans]
MVALYNVEDDYGQNPKTLGDWVKNFRLKRIQMKRKLRSSSGGELRVCAILSTALMTAELELRRKQQERFQKWLEFQTKINKNHELQTRRERNEMLKNHRSSQVDEEMVLVTSDENEGKGSKQSEEITQLWKEELSELDNFMRSISSSGSCRHSINEPTAAKEINNSVGGGGHHHQSESLNPYHQQPPLTSHHQPIEVSS